MPALPANSTDRLWLGYTSMGVRHKLCLRPGGAAGPLDISNLAVAVADAMAVFMYTSDSIFDANFQTSGGVITLPLAFTPVPGTIAGSGTRWEEDPESAFLGFVGRGQLTGRKWHCEFFTALKGSPAWPLTNRYARGVSAPIDTIRDLLAEAMTGTSSPAPITTIGNDPVVMYQYVNIAKNAYWQREQRQ